MDELKHLQKVILEITKDIDFLCRKNDIEYFLLGGSAIGAIRHKGFIPWDDDLDIIMTRDNYEKFIDTCKSQLDKKKYYLQEALIDWPLLHTKIKLLGTHFKEPSGFADSPEHNGIFVDVFTLENVPNSKICQIWQFICSKILLTYCLKKRGFDKKQSFIKELLMKLSFPLDNKYVFQFFKWQMTKYNSRGTNFYGFFSGRYRFKQSIYKKELYQDSIRVPFEDTELPVPKKYDELLSQVFGDYMTPPPTKDQVGLHLIEVDFGQY